MFARAVTGSTRRHSSPPSSQLQPSAAWRLGERGLLLAEPGGILRQAGALRLSGMAAAGMARATSAAEMASQLSVL